MPFTWIKRRSDFGAGKAGGGKTGSQECKELSTDVTHQLKLPISEAGMVRKMKAWRSDHENFGEFIAARALQHMLPPGQIPNLFLLDMEDGQGIGVASEYLQETNCVTLDDYLDPGRKRPVRKIEDDKTEYEHVKLINGSPTKEHEAQYHDLNKLPPHIRKQLAEAIAVSAIIGDHDINPGNMLVIKDDDGAPIRLARIDFGHAFEDLLRGPNSGGVVHDNRMIDFFNRKFLASINPRGEPSKLWRDYLGLIPSQEVVTAMNELVIHKDTNAIHTAIDEVKNTFKAMFDDRLRHINEANPNDKDKQIAEFQVFKAHVMKSLINIIGNSSTLASLFISKPRNPYPLAIDPNDSTALDEIFNAIELYIQWSLEDMEKAARLMQIQVDIDSALQLENQQTQAERLALIKEDYEGKLKNNLLPTPQCWVKTAPNSNPISGTFDTYVTDRRKTINVHNPEEWDFADIPPSTNSSLNDSPHTPASVAPPTPLHKLQDDIDEAITSQTIGKPAIRYKLDMAFLDISPEGLAVTWPKKATAGEKEFIGTIESYIAHRTSKVANQVDLIIDKKRYHHIEAITDPKQVGTSGFYRADDRQFYRVTQNSPGTCLAESLAIIYSPVKDAAVARPPIMQANVYTTQKGKDVISVSVQDKILPDRLDRVMPLSALTSRGFSKKSSFAAVTRGMSPEVKKQLANVIYTSQLNGDENLHPSQLICSVSALKEIHSITRINLNAIGQAGLARTDFDPLNTSKAFSCGKPHKTNYVDYLTQDPEVKEELLMLWAQTNPEDVVRETQQRFIEQLAHLQNPLIKQEAITAFYRTLTNDDPKRMTPEASVEETVRVLCETTRIRCQRMQMAAKLYLATDILEKIKQSTVGDSVTLLICKHLLELLKNPGVETGKKLENLAGELVKHALPASKLAARLQVVLHGPAQAAATPHAGRFFQGSVESIPRPGFRAEAGPVLPKSPKS
ncbi:MAG: hypothetical protein NTW08_03340 [Gammaproteobacteria bacterium]|nr:hypothetical protein [Gammaproteobacteria bacterium]